MESFTQTEREEIDELRDGWTLCSVQLADGRKVVFYVGDHLLLELENVPGLSEAALSLVGPGDNGLREIISCRHVIQLTLESLSPGASPDERLLQLVEIY